MRKPAFCICENKDADQLRGARKADQRLCFRYIDGTIPLFPISEISSHLLWSYSPVCETPKPGFVVTLHIISAPLGVCLEVL